MLSEAKDWLTQTFKKVRSNPSMKVHSTLIPIQRQTACFRQAAVASELLVA
jgi:hypothetical protein